MEAKLVRELPKEDWQGEACLVECDGEFFVVSSVVAMFTGFETLAFRSDSTGKVSDYLEVAGGRGMSREETIAQLQDGVRYG